MNADIVRNMVNYLNDQAVALSGNNKRSRELPINCDNALSEAQAGDCFQLYMQRQNYNVDEFLRTVLLQLHKLSIVNNAMRTLNL